MQRVLFGPVHLNIISDYVRIAVFQIEYDDACDILQKVRINFFF